jgi:hypothetical protein
MPAFFRKIFYFKQMDFEMAVWEMTHLLIAPKKVFKSIYYHKRMPPISQPSNHYTRLTIYPAETKHTFHRPDPSFTYLLCLFLLLTSFAWSLAYTPAFSNVVKLAVMFVFVHFLAGSVVLSTAAYFLVGRFLGPGIAGLPGRRRQQGLFGPPGGTRGDVLEFGYCYDVSTRAFFPPYVFLYIVQFVLLPVIRHDNRASEFFGNLLYLAAATYWTVITFLGYNALHFLHHTQLLLSPMALWLCIWLVCTITGINLSDWGVRWLFLGVHRL